MNDTPFLQQVELQVITILNELVADGRVQIGNLVVIGCSTSEVIGEQIGKAGVPEVAEAIFRGVMTVTREHGIHPVFQCCEHLNRALVLESSVAGRFGYESVTVVPVAKAGGALAAHAYRDLNEPCVVETVRAHAAIDIGNTLIGMHLRAVAVPFRPTQRTVGKAPVTAAFTRPKLIGGNRAVYDK